MPSRRKHPKRPKTEWKLLWTNQIKEVKNFANWQKKSLVFCRFSSLHRKISELKGKGHEPSRAELKILQLKLQLEPAPLGLITTIFIHKSPKVKEINHKFKPRIVFLIHEISFLVKFSSHSAFTDSKTSTCSHENNFFGYLDN